MHFLAHFVDNKPIVLKINHAIKATGIKNAVSKWFPVWRFYMQSLNIDNCSSLTLYHVMFSTNQYAEMVRNHEATFYHT